QAHPASTRLPNTPSKHTPSKLQAHALQALQAEGTYAGAYAEGAYTDGAYAGGAYAGGCSVKLWNNDLGRRVHHVTDERCQRVRKPQEPSPKTICQKPTAPRLQVLK